jgi:hypothetical protein
MMRDKEGSVFRAINLAVQTGHPSAYASSRHLAWAFVYGLLPDRGMNAF